MEAHDTEAASVEGLKLDGCFSAMDGLFARIGALSNPELRKLLLRDLMEEAGAKHRELE